MINIILYRESICLKTFNNLEIIKINVSHSKRLQNFNNIWYTCLYAVTKWNLSTKHIFYCVSFSSLLEDCKFPPERIKEVSETYQVIMVKKFLIQKCGQYISHSYCIILYTYRWLFSALCSINQKFPFLCKIKFYITPLSNSIQFNQKMSLIAIIEFWCWV